MSGALTDGKQYRERFPGVWDVRHDVRKVTLYKRFLDLDFNAELHGTRDRSGC